MVKRTLALLLIMALLFVGIAPVLAGGTTTITASGDAQPIGNSSGNDWWWGQSFTVASGVVTQITVTHGTNVGSPAGTATWELRDNNAGAPGTVLGSGTYTPTASTTNTLNITGPSLAAATTYWLVIHSTSPQATNVQWRWQSSTTSVYAGGNASLSSNGGSSWAAQSTVDLQMSITTTDPTATPTPSNTPLPSNTPTSTWTPTHTWTPTSTWTPTASVTVTETWTPTHTWTPTPGASPTGPTPLPTYTFTPTETYTPTASWTPTYTFTPTYTWTPTETPSWTPTSTWTATPSETPTLTGSETPTPIPPGSGDYLMDVTLSSGKHAALEYSMTMGDVLQAALIVILLGITLFIAYLHLRQSHD